MAERLRREDWAHHTQGMGLGEKRRVPHICGPGRTLMVSADGEGYRAWCFRCALGDRMPLPAEGLATKLARMRAAVAEDTLAATAEPPGPAIYADAIGEWPMPARLWLYRAGLGALEIARLGAYYHPPTSRVVLPVLGPSGAIVYWQARSVDGRMPKYLGSTVGRHRAVPRYGESSHIVVTEDILSAFKVGAAGREGWCALGTRLSAAFMAALLKADKPACVWLDPDPAGQAGAAKIIKQLTAYGVPVRNIVSARDPKLHSKDEIRDIIQA